jgi:hypothetical protein
VRPDPEVGQTVRRIVVDPSVLVAAVLTNGVARRVVGAGALGRFTMVVCPLLLDELAGVLARPRFERWRSRGERDEFVMAVSGNTISNMRRRCRSSVATVSASSMTIRFEWFFVSLTTRPVRVVVTTVWSMRMRRADTSTWRHVSPHSSPRRAPVAAASRTNVPSIGSRRSASASAAVTSSTAGTPTSFRCTVGGLASTAGFRGSQPHRTAKRKAPRRTECAWRIRACDSPLAPRWS